MEAILSLLALIGMGFAAVMGLKWMARIGQANARRDLQLTPNDLKILEESTARLMSDLKTVTDECVARIERACADAEYLLKSLEPAMQHSSDMIEVESYTKVVDTPVVSADTPESTVCIARQAGMTNGEVELLKGLMAIGK